MTYRRYELYDNGSKHNAGLLSDTEATGAESRFYYECAKIYEVTNAELPVPPYHRLGQLNTAYFTEAGYAKFKPYMDRLAELVEAAGYGWHAEVTEVDDFAEDMILYRDVYQVIVRKEMPKMDGFDAVGFMMAYECGDLPEEKVIAGYQKLIDSGIVWSLQGHYGRTASYLIEEGYCNPASLAADDIAFSEAEEDAL